MDAASNHRKDIMTEPVALSVSKQKHSRSIARAKRKKQKHSKTKGMNVHKQTVKKRIDKAKSSATSCKKIRDKIKKISIRVPGDPNALYKQWKKSKFGQLGSLKKVKSSPQIHSMQHMQRKPDKLDLDAMKVRNRQRLNSYPPMGHGTATRTH